MRKIYLTLAFAALAIGASAQNLNPQVQVTNVYESQAPDVRKQDIPVSVPDSVMHFDYVFDYSVFDSPYKGAYEFTPYAVNLVPEKTSYEARKLYLRAGMGYNPYPVLKAVWSPETAEGFDMSIRQDLSGYWGNYFLPGVGFGPIDEKYTGRDLEEKFAVEGRIPSSNRIISFCADYDGIFTSDYLQSTNYHSVGLKAGIKSNTVHTGSFVYDVNLSARYAAENISHDFSPLKVQEVDIDLSGSLGTMLNTVDRLLVDYDFRLNRMPGTFDGSAIRNVSLAPHIILKYDRFDLDLGVRMDYVTKIALHPQAMISFALIKDELELYAGVKGAENVLTYSYLKHFDHFFNPSYTEDFQRSVNEKYNAFLGLKGHHGAHFNYSLEAGRAKYAGAPFETVACDRSGTLRPGIDYFDYGVWFADLKAAWKSPRFEADAVLGVRKTSLDASSHAVDLPLLSADLRAVYNWRERTFLGVSCEMLTARQFTMIGGPQAELPFTANLAAFAQYKFNSKWGVWIKGGNLLNQFIRRTPLHIEEGINFTAGICLSL